MEQDYLGISWKNLPWSLFKKKIFHLQCKIYNAKKNGDFRLVKRLQKLLIYSSSSHFIATRFLVGEIVNSKYYFSDFEKVVLAYSIRSVIKKDSFLHILRLSNSPGSLDCSKALVIQYILRLALEPLHYDKGSWLLSKRDEELVKVVKKIKLHLKGISDFDTRKVLKFEINSCLKNLSYDYIKKNFVLPNKYKLFIHKSLVENSFSALLLKNGLADFLRNLLLTGCTSINNFDLVNKRNSTKQKKGNLDKLWFTYSNVVVCFLKERDNFYSFVESLKELLRNHGLTLNLSSISLSLLSEGFDFFGWFFKKLYKKRVFISISYTNWVLYKRFFKLTLNKNYGSYLKINKINFLNFNWLKKYSIVSRSILKSKFYLIKKLVQKYGKNLKFLEKKILFKSFKFEVPILSRD